MRRAPSKAGYYCLEGLNSFATTYYFNYLMFLLREEHGFSSLQNLMVGALHGLLYIGASWYGGRFGQRHGYFRSLRLGLAGLAASLTVGWLCPSWWGQLIALAGWTFTICFTWPVLEALVSERESPERLPGRVGLYNVVWAGAAAVALSTGGWIYQQLGHASLYWLPLGIHVLQWIWTWPLQTRYAVTDPAKAAAAEASSREVAAPSAAPSVPRPRYFQKLAWLANPFSYMAVNTLVVMVPGIADQAGLTVAQAGLVMSVWFYVRALSFLKLWYWQGWHYRFDWFVGAFALLLVGFITLMVSRWVPLMILAQVAFGWAAALLYYSSLYYSMDGSDAHAELGGIHEALIGVGICAGPALSAVTWWATGRPEAPAWVVATLISGALTWVWQVRRRAVS